jgi:hypothetical protein
MAARGGPVQEGGKLLFRQPDQDWQLLHINREPISHYLVRRTGVA